MPISAPYSITNCRRFFAEPATPRQRQYEALRAFYLEGLTSAHAAERFGYSPGALRVLCHAFRRGELPEFFAATRPGPRDQPKKSAAQEQIIALRKRNYSVYDISRALKQQGTPLSATAVREVLAAQGFAPLPRRLDEERPVLVGPSTEAAMSAASRWRRASSPPGWEGYSCSSPIWSASSLKLWRSAPSFRVLA